VSGVELPDLGQAVAFTAQSWEALDDGASYLVGGYLETDAETCGEDGPSYGELVVFGPDACPSVTYTEGQAIEGVELDLNFAVPF
jgi:hypothetical protein